MKKTAFFLVIFFGFIIFLNSLAAFAGSKPDNSKEDIKKIKERLVLLRNWQLMEEFDLSSQRAQKVFNILKRFDDKRIKLIQKRRKIINKLRQAVKNRSYSDKKLNKLMDEFNKVNIAIAKLPNEERLELSTVFTPREQARYILFAQRFARNMRQIVKRSRASK